MTPDDLFTAVLAFVVTLQFGLLVLGVITMTVQTDIQEKVGRITAAVGTIGTEVAAVGNDVRGLAKRIDDLLANQAEGLTRDQAIALSNDLGTTADKAEAAAAAAAEINALTPDAPPAEPPAPPAEPPPAETPAEPVTETADASETSTRRSRRSNS